MVDHLVFYWSGDLPEVAELSIASALARFPEAKVEFFLDDDPGFKGSIPSSLKWLFGHPRLNLHHLPLEDYVLGCGFLPYEPSTHLFERLGNALFQIFDRSRLRKTAFARQLSLLAPWLRPILGHYNHIYGWFRASSVSHALQWAGPVYRDDVFKIVAELNFPGESVLCADLDVYFAKPSEQWPFEKSFTSRWGDEKWANNPVLFLGPYRNSLSQKFHMNLKRGLPAAPWHFFSDQECLNYGVTVLPVDQFDPPWSQTSVSSGSSELFMSNSELNQAFVDEIRARSLSVHWHNQWQRAPEPGSPYKVFLKECRDILAQRDGIAPR